MVICMGEANGPISLHEGLGGCLRQLTDGRNSPRLSFRNEPYLADQKHEAKTHIDRLVQKAIAD